MALSIHIQWDVEYKIHRIAKCTSRLCEFNLMLYQLPKRINISIFCHFIFQWNFNFYRFQNVFLFLFFIHSKITKFLLKLNFLHKKLIWLNFWLPTDSIQNSLHNQFHYKLQANNQFHYFQFMSATWRSSTILWPEVKQQIFNEEDSLNFFSFYIFFR